MPAQTIVGKIKMIMQTDCAAQMRTWNLLCTSALISNAPGTEEQYLEKCLTTVLWMCVLSCLHWIVFLHDVAQKKMYMSKISDQLILRIYALPMDFVWV